MAFVALTALYRAGGTRDLDREALLRLRDVHTPWLAGLAAADGDLFRPTPTFAAALVLAVVLWRFGPRWSWCAPGAIVVTVLIEVIVRNGWSQVLHVRTLIEGLQAVVGGHYYVAGSFPSGHVARAIFLMVIVFAFLPRLLSIPLALLALTTPLARMYTENHRLSDVLGGAVLGLCIGSVAVLSVLALARMKTGSRPPPAPTVHPAVDHELTDGVEPS